MQIKLFAIPIPDAEALNEELNKFLRAHKVLQVDQHVVSNEAGNYWCFSVRYIEGVIVRDREKVDYMKVLDEDTFKRFSKMRALRKQLAVEDAVPPFAIFTDEELAGMAKLESPLTVEDMKGIPGIGEKKVSKYGLKFMRLLNDAQG